MKLGKITAEVPKATSKTEQIQNLKDIWDPDLKDTIKYLEYQYSKEKEVKKETGQTLEEVFPDADLAEWVQDKYLEDQPQLNIYMTSYNAEVGQTDSTPCIAWGTWINICDAEKEGRRIIALSQELTAWSTIGKRRKKIWSLTFEPWEKVILKQSEEHKAKYWHLDQCNWDVIVWDAMNVRYRKRWDLFFSDRKYNTSCDVTIYKL